MTGRLRWAGAVPAGLGWIFLARLVQDGASEYALNPPLSAPPLVVAALLLPFRAGLAVLTLVLLLHDSGQGIPFGLSATVALPVYVVLFRLRHHFSKDSVWSQAALAGGLTPLLHAGSVFFLGLAGGPLADRSAGILAETVIGVLLAALFTPWLASLSAAFLKISGANSDPEAIEP